MYMRNSQNTKVVNQHQKHMMYPKSKGIHGKQYIYLASPKIRDSTGIFFYAITIIITKLKNNFFIFFIFHFDFSRKVLYCDVVLVTLVNIAKRLRKLDEN